MMGLVWCQFMNHNNMKEKKQDNLMTIVTFGVIGYLLGFIIALIILCVR